MGNARLTDKVAIVTGSGQGIGEAIAKVFAAEGARVVVATRTEKNGRQVVEAINQAAGEAMLFTIDIGELEQINHLVAATVEAYGRIDIMVHNAASFLGGAVENYSEEDLETVLAVNLKPCFRLSRACIPYMKKQGGGRLLFTSSVTGPRVVMPGTAYYAASKGGINAFIRTAAIELARDNITVNGVEPGYIRTAAMELLADEEGMQQMARYIPTGEIGEPNDIANCMLFLATAEAKYITGQTIVVDGGSTLPESPAFLDELDGMKELQGSS
ncbi:MAG: SDR family oxidoreductase [Gammaproteobacteria bacterium]